MGMEGNQRTTPQCYPKLCTLDQWYCDPFRIFQTSVRYSKGRCSVVTINDLSESLCSSTLNPAFGIIHLPHLFLNSTHMPSKRKPKRELPAFQPHPPKAQPVSKPPISPTSNPISLHYQCTFCTRIVIKAHNRSDKIPALPTGQCLMKTGGTWRHPVFGDMPHLIEGGACKYERMDLREGVEMSMRPALLSWGFGGR